MRNLARREFAFRAGLLGASLFALSACAGTGQPAMDRTTDPAQSALESNFITALEHLYLAAPALPGERKKLAADFNLHGLAVVRLES